MGRWARTAWSGIAVVALLAAGWGAWRLIQPSGYELTAEFDDVGDLFEQHSVQIADVRVGQVGDIELTDDFRARVTLLIKHDIDVPVGSTALLRTTSLLGEKFVEIRPPSGEAMRNGPYLEPGSEIGQTATAPELEFVADTLIEVLGAVEASDVAALIDAGGIGFGGQREALSSLVGDLATVSNTLAERSGQLVRIIEELDGTASTLAAGSGDLEEALSHLAETTTILAVNRDRAVDALDQLSRLARVENTVVTEHFDAVNRQIQQVDDILAQLAGRQGDVDSLLQWLERFVVGLPEAIPRDFTNVYVLGVLSDLEPQP